MPVHVALLRGVNVGGTKVPMGELRDLASELGLERPETYIQSGNLVFQGSGTRAELEGRIEEGIERRFGFRVPVIVRTAGEWSAYLQANPFPEVAATAPSRLMLQLSKLPPHADAASAIEERARDGEQVRAAGEALWIHYPAGAGASKLTPALIDRLIGSPSTARNWNTILKVQDMLSR